MPKAKASAPSSSSNELVSSKPKPIGMMERLGGKRNPGRRAPDMSGTEGISIEKHSEKLRYKIAYSAHRLADELATALAGQKKKDPNYIKGLVWSLGVLYDKIKVEQADAVTVRIPSKLLDNVRLVIAAQVQRKQAQATIIEASGAALPSTPLDSESSAALVKS